VPIPTFLQIPLAYCEKVIDRAYDLTYYALQMIHLSTAIRHLFVFLAKKIAGASGEGGHIDIESALASGGDLGDLLRVAPLLCHQLQT